MLYRIQLEEEKELREEPGQTSHCGSLIEKSLLKRDSILLHCPLHPHPHSPEGTGIKGIDCPLFS